MKKLTLISIFFITGIGVTLLINSCAASKKVMEKTGSQLWGENCIRCHNAPSSADYSPAQWETIGMHMKNRANLTDVEIKKIVTFLQSAN